MPFGKNQHMITLSRASPGVGEALPQAGASGQGKDIEQRGDQPISKRREGSDDAMALRFAPPPARQQLA